MNEIRLDPKKLLGFKIIAEGSTSKLSSPKIGDKTCNVFDEDVASGAVAAIGSLQAKIGTETD
jgi:hypothetical protein